MRNIIFSLTFLSVSILNAQNDTLSELSKEEFLASYQKVMDSIEKTLTYETGTIDISEGLAILSVPNGYKFLDAKQSKRVLEEIWGNPPSEPLGLLFPEDTSPVSENFTYAVEIEYSEDGYIDDEDAADLDYDDLLEEMQGDTDAASEERQKQGYESIELMGWAAKPFYDSENHKLHWAKEIKFEGQESNTLNYNIRVLGRKGYLNLNAIGDIEVLPVFQNDVDNILASVEFTEGNKYSDFDSNIDEVAAYGIGGLIVGKVLAKAGLFALLLKFWKVIAVAVVGGFAGFRKFFKKDKES